MVPKRGDGKQGADAWAIVAGADGVTFLGIGAPKP